MQEQAGTSGDETPDVAELWYIEERTDVAQWLTERGWQVSSLESHEMMQSYGRSVENAPRTVYIEGHRPD